MKFFSVVLAIFAVVLAVPAFAEDKPCPQGHMCSENYMMEGGFGSYTNVPQQAVSGPISENKTEIKNNFSNNSTAKLPIKKKFTAEEIEKYKKGLEGALSRDHDKTRSFSSRSQFGACSWDDIIENIYDWLIINDFVIIDKKEYLVSAYSHKINQGFNREKCEKTIVIHYHYYEKPWWKFWQ